MVTLLLAGEYEEGRTGRLRPFVETCRSRHDCLILSRRDDIENFFATPHEDTRAVLFVLALTPYGPGPSFIELRRLAYKYPKGLTNCIGGVIVDGPDEIFTKKVGREWIFWANRAGCTFPGRPLIEGTGSLYNLRTRAGRDGLSLQEEYEKGMMALLLKVKACAEMGLTRHEGARLTVLHTSSYKTSNTMLLWEMVKKNLPPSIEAEEISLRNGAVVDCRGCSYEACLHFGEKGDCFYGGLMVDTVYPAVEKCQALVLLCPNYNDAVSANMMAFFNRLTALYRKDEKAFSRKQIYALVVSGYSGGDIVAEQVLDALSLNKNFILPGKFALIEQANDPYSILKVKNIEEHAKAFAAHMSDNLLK